MLSTTGSPPFITIEPRILIAEWSNMSWEQFIQQLWSWFSWLQSINTALSLSLNAGERVQASQVWWGKEGAQTSKYIHKTQALSPMGRTIVPMMVFPNIFARSEVRSSSMLRKSIIALEKWALNLAKMLANVLEDLWLCWNSIYSRDVYDKDTSEDILYL